MELCDAPFFFSLQVLPLLSSSPISHLFSLPFTLPRSLGPSIFPLPRCSRFPPFSPSRTCVCARAFGLFSCFYAPLVFSLPKYNWRCDAPVSLSLSTPWPPSLARSLASPGEDRAALLAHPASLTSANPRRVPATR